MKNYNIHYIENPNEFLIDNMNQKYCSWDTETSSLRHFDLDFKIGCITMCFDGVNGYYLPFNKINKRVLNKFFNNIGVSITTGGKFDVKALIVSNINNARIDEDIILLYHMLNTSRKHNNLSALSWLVGFGGYDQKLVNFVKTNNIKNYLDIPEKLLIEYSVLDAIVSFKLYKHAMDNLVPLQLSVYNVYKNIIIPVYPVFIEMEIEGIGIDTDYLNELDKKFIKQQNNIETKILKFLNKDININSNEQLAIELEKLKLPCKGTTEKGFFKTGEKILHQWKQEGYKIADLILQYRQLVKLRTGFIGEVSKNNNLLNIFDKNGENNKDDIGIVKSIQGDGKIHSSYGIGMTEPLRQFCSSPNIQQYPGNKELRKIFDFGDNYLFGEFDVSGFHLRLMAYCSNDENMKDVFINQFGDMHSATARSVFTRNLTLEEFIKRKKEEPYNTYRFRSKGINFAFIYNGNEWNLKPDIERDWSEEEMDEYIEKNKCITGHKFGKSYIIAKDIHSKFMDTYRNIPIYSKNQIIKAKKNGYIKTIFGNIRHLPELLYIPKEMDEITKKHYNHLESICTNTEILSMEALMMHIGMKNIFYEFKKNNMKSKIIMMVHDSIGVKIESTECDKVIKICKFYLENFGINLNDIPIESEYKSIGKYWE